MKFKKSQKLYEQGLVHLVGAVNSPVRAFSSVGGNPLFIKKAKGSKITDVDGNEKEFTVPMTVTFLWPNIGI